ncbi:MAG: cobyric acid synthase [Candidatus Sulfotelmatobacter sp.]
MTTNTPAPVGREPGEAITARAIMVLGTASHVGKSLLTAALCRIFAQQGYRVAPFKAQNMSLNSAATPDGLEIGRAQGLQAEAAGIPATVHMNPILIKPAGDGHSQIIVRGKIWGHLSAGDYHQSRVEELAPVVRESYEFLAAQNDVIVLEGAGSPAEINLKAHDIVNMRMAELADARCLLVGDIDRGGVFAALLGTLELLDPAERARICGFVINKFRGNLHLLTPGIHSIEQRLGKPCLGVIPFLHELMLDEEDSVGLPSQRVVDWSTNSPASRELRIAVICLPSLSNFTDFDPLLAEPSVSLRFFRKLDELAVADVVIIPGSKQTVDDLEWMRTRGLDHSLQEHANRGLTVGLCGGMQMLGREIHDPHWMEGRGSTPGLGILPIRTIMQQNKVTEEAGGSLIESSLFGESVHVEQLRGYEIHIGETIYLPGARPFAILQRNSASDQTFEDGCTSEDRRTFGTYLHGLFDEDTFRHEFIRAARSFHKLAPAPSFCDWKQHREQALNRLATEVTRALDIKTIFQWVGLQHTAN